MFSHFRQRHRIRIKFNRMNQTNDVRESEWVQSAQDTTTYSRVQYDIIQYSTLLSYTTPRNCTVVSCSLLYNTSRYCTVRLRTWPLHRAKDHLSLSYLITPILLDTTTIKETNRIAIAAFRKRHPCYLYEAQRRQGRQKLGRRKQLSRWILSSAVRL